MELNVPVFNLRLLKRHFYTFLLISVCFAFVSILIHIYIQVQVPETVVKAVKSWGLFLLLLILSFLYSRLQKKELKKILHTEDSDQKFLLYERFYKNKLIWVIFSQCLLNACWLITHTKFLFYFILIQLILGLVFYPSRRVISKELKDMEIVFV
jgi:hypothetical protein